jgi:GT2 family glycosyltransferase
MHLPTVGILIPTLGTRPEFLIQALKSIRLAGNALVHIIAPNTSALETQIPNDLYDSLIDDLGMGLASAIDLGLRSFPSHIEYINWLGDDDLLSPKSIENATKILSENERIVLVYGRCDYISESGKVIWRNSSGSYAKWLMRFGPQLISQPGSLFRRDAYEHIGGLDNRYKWAFDLDLLIRLSRVGEFRYIPFTFAQFRWHQGSLSVGGRRGSINEASEIRIAALPRWFRASAHLWEKFVKYIIFIAGAWMSVRSKRRDNSRESHES